MEKIECNQGEKDGSSIEGVEIPLSGDDSTVPAVCEFDRSVNRPKHDDVREMIGAFKRSTNLMTTRKVLILIPVRRSLVGCGTREKPAGCPWRVASLEPGTLLRAGRST